MVGRMRGWSFVLTSSLLFGCGEPKPAPPSVESSASKADPQTTVAPKTKPKPAKTIAAGTLEGTVQAAPPGVKGFDTFASVKAHAGAIAKAGYGFAVRYVMLESSKTNLTRDEAQAVLDAGMALMIVQQGAEWKDRKPSTSWGQRHGAAAREGATTVGYPSGAVLWLDLESVKEGDTSDVDAYVRAWRAEVEPQYTAGLYVGPNVPLTDTQLAALDLQHYWKSGVTHLQPEGIGYQLMQAHAHVSVDGVGVDIDHTSDDAKGGAVRWLQPDGWAPPAAP